jgi:hypothetical protein
MPKSDEHRWPDKGDDSGCDERGYRSTPSEYERVPARMSNKYCDCPHQASRDWKENGTEGDEFTK